MPADDGHHTKRTTNRVGDITLGLILILVFIVFVFVYLTWEFS